MYEQIVYTGKAAVLACLIKSYDFDFVKTAFIASFTMTLKMALTHYSTLQKTLGLSEVYN